MAVYRARATIPRRQPGPATEPAQAVSSGEAVQEGLSIDLCLRRGGIDHLVLERGHAAQVANTVGTTFSCHHEMAVSAAGPFTYNGDDTARVHGGSEIVESLPRPCDSSTRPCCLRVCFRGRPTTVS